MESQTPRDWEQKSLVFMFLGYFLLLGFVVVYTGVSFLKSRRIVNTEILGQNVVNLRFKTPDHWTVFSSQDQHLYSLINSQHVELVLKSFYSPHESLAQFVKEDIELLGRDHIRLEKGPAKKTIGTREWTLVSYLRRPAGSENANKEPVEERLYRYIHRDDVTNNFVTIHFWTSLEDQPDSFFEEIEKFLADLSWSLPSQPPASANSRELEPSWKKVSFKDAFGGYFLPIDVEFALPKEYNAQRIDSFQKTIWGKPDDLGKLMQVVEKGGDLTALKDLQSPVLHFYYSTDVGYFQEENKFSIEKAYEQGKDEYARAGINIEFQRLYFGRYPALIAKGSSKGIPTYVCFIATLNSTNVMVIGLVPTYNQKLDESVWEIFIQSIRGFD